MKTVFLTLLLSLSFPLFAQDFSLFDDAQADQSQNNFVEKDQKNRNRRGKNRAGRGKRGGMLKKLGLTQEQITQFKEIKSKHKSKFKNNRQKMKELKQELQQLMKSTQNGSDYRNTVLAKVDELHNLKGETKRARIEMALDIREILNPEQIQKFMQIKLQRKDRRKGRGNRNWKERRGQQGWQGRR